MCDKIERPNAVPTSTYKGEFICNEELHSFFLRLGDHPDTSKLIEAFLTIGSAGRCRSCMGDGIARLISFALQDGMKPERVVHAFRGIQCPTAVAGAPSSCLDWIANTIERHEKEKAARAMQVQELVVAVEKEKKRVETETKKAQLVALENTAKCSECEKMGQVPKRIQYVGSSTTLLSFDQYQDSAGVLHSHDPNRVRRGYQCDNGHYWEVAGYNECPACDWHSGKQ